MKILLLGATGSIGTQTIEVIKKLNYSLVGISYCSNHTSAKKIIKNNHLKYYYCSSDCSKSSVKNIDELISLTNPDLVVNSVVGFAGLESTIKVLQHKKNIALANKESLVVGGKLVMDLAKINNVNIYPIDSEHTSLMQLVRKYQDDVDTLYITASGGRYYNWTKKQKELIKFEDAIKHPNWNMGAKISIDSSTLMNKCFEIIEAYWYFSSKKIYALYHPQSLIHSALKTKNNSYFCNMSTVDMKLPIELALTNFSTNVNVIKPLDFNNGIILNLQNIDENKHLPIKWAYDVIKNPNNLSLPIILNASNEIAIELFKDKKIKYTQIIEIINWAIDNIKSSKISTLEDIFKFDAKVRKIILERWNK